MYVHGYANIYIYIMITPLSTANSGMAAVGLTL